jgi:hypothetical protein
MVNVWEPPSFTETEPEGVMVPFDPWVVVMVWEPAEQALVVKVVSLP